MAQCPLKTKLTQIHSSKSLICDKTYIANSLEHFSNEFKHIHAKLNSNDL